MKKQFFFNILSNRKKNFPPFSSKCRFKKFGSFYKIRTTGKEKVFDSAFNILLLLTFVDGIFFKKNTHPDWFLVKEGGGGCPLKNTDVFIIIYFFKRLSVVLPE
jgi:hypothetical protein